MNRAEEESGRTGSEQFLWMDKIDFPKRNCFARYDTVYASWLEDLLNTVEFDILIGPVWILDSRLYKGVVDIFITHKDVWQPLIMALLTLTSHSA